MAFAYCPDCGTRIYLGHRPWLGQPTMCDYCDADLEVVHLNPVELDWVSDEGDGDWHEEPEVEYEPA